MPQGKLGKGNNIAPRERLRRQENGNVFVVLRRGNLLWVESEMNYEMVALMMHDLAKVRLSSLSVIYLLRYDVNLSII